MSVSMKASEFAKKVFTSEFQWVLIIALLAATLLLVCLL
jgi:hypothetical protein